MGSDIPVDSATSLLIVTACFKTPEFGIPISTRNQGLQKENFFKGKDAVDGMIALFGVSRDEAVLLGSLLLACDLIKCTSFATFKDDLTAYRIIDTELENNFIIENLAEAVNLLLTSNVQINQALLEDVAFISKLSTSGLIEYNTKKHMALQKMNNATTPDPVLNKKTKKNVPRTNSVKSLTKTKDDRSAKERMREEKASKDKKEDKNSSKDDKVYSKKGGSSLFTSSSEIIVDENSYYEEDSDDIKFSFTDENYQFPKVKSASIDKLIERLTHEVYPDLQFRTTFMLTYRSFMTPAQLLEKLDQRFHSPNIVDSPAVLKTVQLRVVGTVKLWLENYVDDFLGDQTLQENLNELINKMANTIGGPAHQLCHLLQKKIADRSLPDSVVEPRTVELGPEITWENLSELEIAHQICILEFRIFSSILAKETLNLNWSKHKERSPNVLALIEQFNRTSRWVQQTIVSKVKLTDRIASLSKFISLAYILFELNNYNGVMEVLSGINSSPVRRLKKTWEELPPAAVTKLKHLEKVMSHDGSYREYRAILHNCDPPTIPYLGTYLTDLTFIEDGNQNLDGQLINFDKRYKVAAVIGEIQQYQRIGYESASITIRWDIQHWLKTLPSVDEEEAYRISLKVEPRNPDEALESLLMEEQKLREEVKALQLRNADLEESSRKLQGLLNNALQEINRMKRMTRGMGPMAPVHINHNNSNNNSTPANGNNNPLNLNKKFSLSQSKPENGNLRSSGSNQQSSISASPSGSHGGSKLATNITKTQSSSCVTSNNNNNHNNNHNNNNHTNNNNNSPSLVRSQTDASLYTVRKNTANASMSSKATLPPSTSTARLVENVVVGEERPSSTSVNSNTHSNSNPNSNSNTGVPSGSPKTDRQSSGMVRGQKLTIPQKSVPFRRGRGLIRDSNSARGSPNNRASGPMNRNSRGKPDSQYVHRSISENSAVSAPVPPDTSIALDHTSSITESSTPNTTTSPSNEDASVQSQPTPNTIQVSPTLRKSHSMSQISIEPEDKTPPETPVTRSPEKWVWISAKKATQ